MQSSSIHAELKLAFRRVAKKAAKKARMRSRRLEKAVDQKKMIQLNSANVQVHVEARVRKAEAKNEELAQRAAEIAAVRKAANLRKKANRKRKREVEKDMKRSAKIAKADIIHHKKVAQRRERRKAMIRECASPSISNSGNNELQSMFCSHCSDTVQTHLFGLNLVNTADKVSCFLKIGSLLMSVRVDVRLSLERNLLLLSQLPGKLDSNAIKNFRFLIQGADIDPHVPLSSQRIDELTTIHAIARLRGGGRSGSRDSVRKNGNQSSRRGHNISSERDIAKSSDCSSDESFTINRGNRRRENSRARSPTQRHGRSRERDSPHIHRRERDDRRHHSEQGRRHRDASARRSSSGARSPTQRHGSRSRERDSPHIHRRERDDRPHHSEQGRRHRDASARRSSSGARSPRSCERDLQRNCSPEACPRGGAVKDQCGNVSISGGTILGDFIRPAQRKINQFFLKSPEVNKKTIAPARPRLPTVPVLTLCCPVCKKSVKTKQGLNGHIRMSKMCSSKLKNIDDSDFKADVVKNGDDVGPGPEKAAEIGRGRRGADIRNIRPLKKKIEIAEKVVELRARGYPKCTAVLEVAKSYFTAESNVKKWYSRLAVNKQKFEAEKNRLGKGKSLKSYREPATVTGKFPDMESAVHKEFILLRQKARKVTGSRLKHLARVYMKKLYPSVSLSLESTPKKDSHQRNRGKSIFVASDGWLHRFCKRFKIRFRTRSNMMVKSAEEQQPSCEAYVKSLQLFKNKYIEKHESPVYGRWDICDTFNADEMGLSFEGDNKTYADTKRSDGVDRLRIHVRQGAGIHRFATLLVFTRARGKQVPHLHKLLMFMTFLIKSFIFRWQSLISFLGALGTSPRLSKINIIKNVTFIFKRKHGWIVMSGQLRQSLSGTI